MGRLVGLALLFFGMGMTAYYSAAREGRMHNRPAAVDQGVHSVDQEVHTMEGTNGPPPRP